MISEEGRARISLQKRLYWARWHAEADPSRKAMKNGYVWMLALDEYEHRAVMAAHIGRPLLDTEVVHHSNRNRRDNRLENLVLFASNSDHIAHHEREVREGREPARPVGRRARGLRRSS